MKTADQNPSSDSKIQLSCSTERTCIRRSSVQSTTRPIQSAAQLPSKFGFDPPNRKWTSTYLEASVSVPPDVSSGGRPRTISCALQLCPTVPPRQQQSSTPCREPTLHSLSSSFKSCRCSLGVSGTSMSMLPSFLRATMSSEAIRTSRSSADSAAAAAPGMSVARLPDARFVVDEEAPERASVRKSVRRTSEADLEREWPLGFDIGSVRVGGREGGGVCREWRREWGRRGGEDVEEEEEGAETEIVARKHCGLKARAHVGGPRQPSRRRPAARPTPLSPRWLPPPPPPSQCCQFRNSPGEMRLLEDRR